jgi:hypothetical protein
MFDTVARRLISGERAQELQFAARRRVPEFEPAPSTIEEAVALRLCTVHDDPGLERLAALEGHDTPKGRFLLAEVDGQIVAAQPLAGGPPLTDPFRATAHLLPLLQLRAKQLTEPELSRRRGILARRWSPVRNQ